VISFNNYSTGAILNQWTFGAGTGSSDLNPVHTYPDTGSYLVTLFVQNIYGCTDTVSQIVEIIPVFSVFVPNAFTPNGDGINDIFTLEGMGIVELTLNIFNRWGENIYTSNGFGKGWDGTVQKNNQQAQQDVYVYDAHIIDVFGRPHHRYGRVTLVR
jgi:gliding motility-associated-like protein